MGFNWNLLDEDCSSLADWNIDDMYEGVTEVDPAGQFRMDTNSPADDYNMAAISQDLGSFPDTYTIQIKLYHDALGSVNFTDYDNFEIDCFNADNAFRAEFRTDGLFIYDTGEGSNNRNEVGTNLVKYGENAEWQTWTFLITFTDTDSDATVDIYLDDSSHDNELVGNQIPCAWEYSYGTIGEIKLEQNGETLDDRVAHVDFVKVGSGHIYVDKGIRIYDGSSNISIGTQPLNGHKLRIYDGSNTYGIPLLETSDSLATSLRIYDSSALINIVTDGSTSHICTKSGDVKSGSCANTYDEDEGTFYEIDNYFNDLNDDSEKTRLAELTSEHTWTTAYHCFNIKVVLWLNFYAKYFGDDKPPSEAEIEAEIFLKYDGSWNRIEYFNKSYADQSGHESLNYVDGDVLKRYDSAIGWDNVKGIKVHVSSSCTGGYEVDPIVYISEIQAYVLKDSGTVKTIPEAILT